MTTSKPPEFELGKTTITAEANDVLEEIIKAQFPNISNDKEFITIFKTGITNQLLTKHRRLEQGLLNEKDCQSNLNAVKHEGDPDRQLRVFSHFEYEEIRFYVITEQDRSYTTILLPHEY